MDLRSAHIDDTDLTMPIPSSASYGVLLEASNFKLLRTCSSNGMPVDDLRPLETAKKNIVRYRECLKNHAASIGGHAIDGCGEFLPSGEDGTMEALKCAACDCHRNFHRREVDGEPPVCVNCLLHVNVKDRTIKTTTGQLSPPLALPSSAARREMAMDAEEQEGEQAYAPGRLKKRFRTKFCVGQKEKMWNFAEKLGWRIQRDDEAEVLQFCADVGVKRRVFKVWMHNNKHTFVKPLPSTLSPPQHHLL